MKRRIHVNQHVIRKNQKTGEREAPLTCKSYRDNLRGHQVDILDPEGQVIASVLYRPDDPLGCGARVWIETEAEVRIHEDQGPAASGPLAEKKEAKQSNGQKQEDQAQ